MIHPQSGLTNVPSAAASQGHGSFNGPLGKSSYAHGADNILRYNNQNNGDGSYEFDFETENKISQKEVGHLENIGTDSESNVVQGAYSYVAPNGQTVAVNYIADENGFRTSADGVPQSLHSQNLNRGYGSHRSDGRIPYSGYQNGNQNANNYYGGSGFTNLGRYNVPGSHETGGQFGIAPHGRQNLKTLGQYDGLNQGVSGPYARHQINRQYLPPGSSVHTGY